MANKELNGAYNRAPRKSLVNGRFQPQVVANGVAQEKPIVDWSDKDKNKIQYDLKVRNILISYLGVNEYHFVSHGMNFKLMCDALETLHEGTDEVKQ